MISAQIAKSVNVAGISFSENRAVAANFAIVHDLLVAGGKDGQLTTRTSNTVGTITAASGTHGITTAQVVDLYWTGGQRRGVIVGTVAGTSIPITGGLGDNLPAATTAVVVSPRTSLPAVVAGDNIAFFALYATNRGTFTFAGADNVEDIAYIVDDASVAQWRAGEGTVNPLAAQANTQIFASHGQTSSKTMRVAVLFN